MINRPRRGITVDAGGVLVQPNPAVIADALHQYGGTADLASITRAQYVATVPERVDVPGGPLNPDAWWLHHAAIARYCGITDVDLLVAVDALFAAYRRSDIKGYPLPGARPKVWPHRLPRILLLPVVTNHDGTMAAQLAAAGICQVGVGPGVRVEAVVDSGAVGFAKPDPGIFQIALEALDLPVAQVVHLGDTSIDIDGAVAAGIQPAHLDLFEICPWRDSHRHVRMIGELAEP